jgi:hypothetical protein
MSRRLRKLTLVVATAAVGVGASSALLEGASADASLPVGVSRPASGAPTWAGTWSTTWGAMILRQNGNRVEGAYAYSEGRLRGTVSGRVLRGTWDEAPTRAAPSEAGDFEFTLSPDGKSWTGRWRFAQPGDPWKPWLGTCSGGPCRNGSAGTPSGKASGAPTWAGTWSTTWGAMILRQNGNRVEGAYAYSEGRLRGTVSGRVLRGTWDEAPTRAAPSEAGDFEFTLSPDGKSWTGRWRFAQPGDPWKPWLGTCSGGPCRKS